LALVASAAVIALVLYVVTARHRGKRKIVPDGKIELQQQEDTPSAVECETPSQLQESVSARPQTKTPSVEVESKPTDATEANRFPPEQAESATAVEITQPEAGPVTTEPTKFHEVESHLEVKAATALETGEAGEATESPRPERAAEGAGDTIVKLLPS